MSGNPRTETQLDGFLRTAISLTAGRGVLRTYAAFKSARTKPPQIVETTPQNMNPEIVKISTLNRIFDAVNGVSLPAFDEVHHMLWYICASSTSPRLENGFNPRITKSLRSGIAEAGLVVTRSAHKEGAGARVPVGPRPPAKPERSTYHRSRARKQWREKLTGRLCAPRLFGRGGSAFDTGAHLPASSALTVRAFAY